MTTENEKLNMLLKNIRVPEHGEGAREKTVQAAMAEYNRQQTMVTKIRKGFSSLDRLRGKTQKGGPSMKPISPVFVKITVFAFSAMILIAFSIPKFTSYRKQGVYRAANQDVRSSLEEQASRSNPEVHVQLSPSDRDGLPKGSTNQESLRVVDPFKPMIADKSEAARVKMSVAKEGDRAAPMPATVAGRRPLEKKDREAMQNQTYVGRDRFEAITPNPIKQVTEAPVSTFSIDVDTASYSFVRRALNNGVLPQKDAVRIEELINYFDYDYPRPSGRSVPFEPTVSVFPTPWNPHTQLLHIGIKGFDILPAERSKSNLVFLIDVSGSMNSRDKLPLLKNAFRMLVGTLDPEDSVAMVVYASAAGTVLESTPAREKGKIFAALDRLSAGGSTAGGAGIQQAYALAEANVDPDGVNRVILATDGDFNVGIRDPGELLGFIERKRKTGIFLSVLGFGQGNYNDALMQKLAQNGNGNAAYIDSLTEAQKVLVDEAQSTLFTIAKDVKIQVEFNPARVVEYRLIGYESRLLKRADFNNDGVDAGDVGAGHSVTAIYEMTPEGSNAKLIDDLRYGKRKGASRDVETERTGELAFLKIRYKIPESETSRLITVPIGDSQAYASLDSISQDTRFASAVAAFGQLLRGDPSVKNFTYDDVAALARSARGEDRFGYRTGFLNLVQLAKSARTMGEQ